MVKLMVVKDGVEVQSIDLASAGKSSVLVGRAESADIRLDDRAVGREHALFVINSNGVVVQKKTKFGKLSVNGSETNESPLKPGDVISIADYLVRVEDGRSKIANQAGANSVDGGSVEAGEALMVDAAPDLASVPEGSTSPVIAAVANTSENNASSANSSAASDGLDVEQAAFEVAQEGNLDANLGVDAGSELQQPDFNAAGEDRTAMVSTANITSSLIFPPGVANVEEFVIKKAEISLGRGTNCDIVLADKKASRKHLVIKRVGISFVAVDLGSGNGTYVNGVKISEQELAGNDTLRIGETEFQFKATSQEYFQAEQNQEFIAPPPETEEVNSLVEGASSALPFDQVSIDPALSVSNETTQGGAIPGLNAEPPKKETLLEKFKKQPKPRQAIIVAIVALVVYMVLFGEEEDNKAKKPAPTATPVAVDPADAAFNALPPEKKQAVVNFYNQAMDLYKKQEYDRALYEVAKVHEILNGGYKDSLELKKTAQRQLDLLASEKAERERKEREEKIRKEVAELVAQAEEAVNAGKDQEAKELFAKVLEKDPENPTILRLRQQMEERETERKKKEEAAREAAAKRKALEAVLEEGKALLQSEKYYETIEKMQDALILFANEKDLATEAANLIETAKQTLKSKTEPHLLKAQSAFEGSDYQTARAEWYLALKVDSRCSQAKAGIKKIQEIIHERSRKIFIEAAVAEGVSDYKTAREKFKECIAASVPEDSYFGMCTRKFRRFELIDRSTASSNSSQQADAPRGTDPVPPKLPQPVTVDPPVENPAPPKDAKLEKAPEAPPASQTAPAPPAPTGVKE